MSKIQYAFINECGNYGFDFAGQRGSTHFIVAAILVKERDKENLEHEVELVRQKYFPTSDMKIDRVSHSAGIQLFNELKELPFKVYSLVVDKRKIRDGSGITYKKTFFKYLNRLVFDELYRTFETLDLVVEEKENKEFMQEFKSYAERTSIPDLFHYSTFGFNNSTSDILLQLANFIAGTIGKGYGSMQDTEDYHLFSEILKSKIIGIHQWPLDYNDFLFNYQSGTSDSKHDEVIIKQAVNLAYQYIEKYRKSEEMDEKIRVDFLKFLLFNLKDNPDEYVYTQEILDNLNAIREIKISQHYFRSNIVSKLRDHGLIIASSSKGYKLPVCLSDLYDFVNLASLSIFPMIQRVSKMRDQIMLATNKEIDILDQKEYEYLKRIIESGKWMVEKE